MEPKTPTRDLLDAHGVTSDKMGNYTIGCVRLAWPIDRRTNTRVEVYIAGCDPRVYDCYGQTWARRWQRILEDQQDKDKLEAELVAYEKLHGVKRGGRKTINAKSPWN